MMNDIRETVTRSRCTLVADFAGVLMLAAMTLAVLNLPGLV